MSKGAPGCRVLFRSGWWLKSSLSAFGFPVQVEVCGQSPACLSWVSRLGQSRWLKSSLPASGFLVQFWTGIRTGGRGTLLTHLISSILSLCKQAETESTGKCPCQILQLYLGQPLSGGGWHTGQVSSSADRQICSEIISLLSIFVSKKINLLHSVGKNQLACVSPLYCI